MTAVPPVCPFRPAPGGSLPAVFHVPARQLHLRPRFPGHLVAAPRAGAVPQPPRDPRAPHRPHHRGLEEVHRPLLVPGMRFV